MYFCQNNIDDNSSTNDNKIMITMMMMMIRRRRIMIIMIIIMIIIKFLCGAVFFLSGRPSFFTKSDTCRHCHDLFVLVGAQPLRGNSPCFCRLDCKFVISSPGLSNRPLSLGRGQNAMFGHFLMGRAEQGVCDICMARARARALHTDNTHAFAKSTLCIVSKSIPSGPTMPRCPFSRVTPYNLQFPNAVVLTAVRGRNTQIMPAKTTHEQPSVIDFLLASPDLRTELWPCTRPYPGVRSDHRPIGMAAVAPPPRNDAKGKIIGNPPSPPPPNWKHHLPTNWQPAHPGQWARDLREMQFDTLSDFFTALHNCARPHQTRRTEAQLETARLREAIYQTHPDPIVHMAYQIKLQEHQQQQRRHREYQKTLEQARGHNWEFSHPARTPAAAKLPAELEGKKDRQEWGEALGAFLSNLYKRSETKADKIHQITWTIQNRALRTHFSPLKCHPNTTGPKIITLHHVIFQN